MLTCSIMVGNVKVATLSLVEYRQPLRDGDQDCLEALGKLISKEMQKNINYFRLTDYSAYALLGELLDTPSPDVRSIRRRLERQVSRIWNSFRSRCSARRGRISPTSTMRSSATSCAVSSIPRSAWFTSTTM